MNLSKVSPVFDEFSDAETHAARADILRRAPLSLLSRYCEHFARGCDVTGFATGAEYVALVHSALNARRGPDGEVPSWLREAIAAHMTCLIEIAEGGARRTLPES